MSTHHSVEWRDDKSYLHKFVITSNKEFSNSDIIMDLWDLWHIHFDQICTHMITSPIRLCKKGNISITDML